MNDVGFFSFLVQKAENIIYLPEKPAESGFQKYSISDRTCGIWVESSESRKANNNKKLNHKTKYNFK
jgi:hypothetical protein